MFNVYHCRNAGLKLFSRQISVSLQQKGGSSTIMPFGVSLHVFFYSEVNKMCLYLQKGLENQHFTTQLSGQK